MEILRGVSDGELVVARAGGFLREGDRITAVTPADTRAGAAVISER
ncbi:hypothetical protein ACIKTA_17685 [Hansschlegelia beijingensis]